METKQDITWLSRYSFMAYFMTLIQSPMVVELMYNEMDRFSKEAVG
jgi:hypothetical protein